jgi:hypothetical protein
LTDAIDYDYYIDMKKIKKTFADGNKRFIAWVPTELHRKAKTYAAIHCMDLQDVIREAVEALLEREEAGK